MKLAWKLFISYLVVILMGGVIISVATAYVAPENFSTHLGQMRGYGMMRGREHREALDAQLQAEIDANFRESVNSALLISGIVALVASVGASWYISQRITRPIRQLVTASQRIASGRYNEPLPHKSQDELGELTDNFNRMAAALHETETIRQQLIADVSHELKTPLASINGYMDGLLDGVIEPTQETFVQIQQEASRLQRLVKDLQQLSRAEAGQFQFKIAPCDAVKLVQSSVEWLRPQYEEKGIELQVCVPDEKVEILADSDRVHQVLINLLSNALQYTPAKGSVRVSLEKNGNYAHFSVQDTGVGIAQEDLPRIFQRFYRVDKSRSRGSGGSGIGLTIAQYIVQGLNGRIQAESAGPGKGSTFHFTLPSV